MSLDCLERVGKARKRNRPQVPRLRRNRDSPLPAPSGISVDAEVRPEVGLPRESGASRIADPRARREVRGAGLEVRRKKGRL